ncbi:GNAT family N-acetyltransferase [Adhaeribacter pallidiroseus]|uniref:Asparaginyl-tRNA synthase (Glutamine-hydrolyzing) n=1 Tax=Adhaeribacter pallidiroseus TaxID=2072847 RepID=A0A369QGH0_9BACT|nr:GNAT family protein [Adhaeribacter pallidiroseus]RDC64031.1 Asparaginyl-tRNA synthase (glutamine-hydrolyzing) [Adhaeribacter pallidiroseus]
MNFPIPTELRTERLLLRRYAASDAYDFLQLLLKNQARLSLAFPGRVAMTQKSENAEYFIRQMRADWQSKKVYEFGIWLQDREQYIGDIALKNIEKRVPKGEIGYYLDAAAEGQGLAGEALRAVINFGFDNLALNKLFIKMPIQNQRSYHLAERCGFTREGLLRQDFRSDEKTGLVDVYYYGMTRTDYEMREQAKI